LALVDGKKVTLRPHPAGDEAPIDQRIEVRAVPGPDRLRVFVWPQENFGPNLPDPTGPAQPQALIDARVANAGRILRELHLPEIAILTELQAGAALGTAIGRAADPSGSYLAVESPTQDGRRITNAVLTRLPVLGQRYHGFDGAPKRGILQVDLQTPSGVLSVLAVHAPSRRNRADGERQRLQLAQRLVALRSELEAADPGRRIVIGGDFNEDIGEGSRGPAGLNPAGELQASLREDRFFDVMEHVALNGGEVATERFRGEWSSFVTLIGNPLAARSVHGAEVVDWELTGLERPCGAPLRVFDRNDRSFWREGAPVEWAGNSDHKPVLVEIQA
jgi:hypothetical protein